MSFDSDQHVQLCDAGSSEQFVWPAHQSQFRALLTPLNVGPVKDYVANCETELMLCRVGEHLLPLTVNDSQYENSYVCSPYTGAISYPLVELREINSRALRLGLKGLIHSVAPLLRSAQINRVVCVNNWLLSTNLYPDWNGNGLRWLTQLLVERFPGHAILFRSLNDGTNGPLCERLRNERYLLAPSRQVYMFDDPADYLRHQNSRRDLRLLTEKTEYEIVPNERFTRTDDQRITELYNLLYLEKYTHLNPQFTQRMFRLWRESGTLKLFGLRDSSGSLDGVAGCFERSGILTTPLVGYDTRLPQKTGLYRMLIAMVMRETAHRQLRLNLSSGAAGFKRLRGGKPFMEYTAIYCDHLPAYRRRVWRMLAGLLTRVGAPVLRKFEL